MILDAESPEDNADNLNDCDKVCAEDTRDCWERYCDRELSPWEFCINCFMVNWELGL
jgi:hypothetical protein